MLNEQISLSAYMLRKRLADITLQELSRRLQPELGWWCRITAQVNVIFKLEELKCQKAEN